MYSTTVTLTLRGIQIDFEAEGQVETGGSNRYGSDEPAWVAVEDVALSHNGKPVSDKVTALLKGSDWEAIEEALMDEAGVY
jgi:hypothetical protein